MSSPPIDKKTAISKKATRSRNLNSCMYCHGKKTRCDMPEENFACVACEKKGQPCQTRSRGTTGPEFVEVTFQEEGGKHKQFQRKITSPSSSVVLTPTSTQGELHQQDTEKFTSTGQICLEPETITNSLSCFSLAEMLTTCRGVEPEKGLAPEQPLGTLHTFASPEPNISLEVDQSVIMEEAEKALHSLSKYYSPTDVQCNNQVFVEHISGQNEEITLQPFGCPLTTLNDPSAGNDPMVSQQQSLSVQCYSSNIFSIGLQYENLMWILQLCLILRDSVIEGLHVQAVSTKDSVNGSEETYSLPDEPSLRDWVSQTGFKDIRNLVVFVPQAQQEVIRSYFRGVYDNPIYLLEDCPANTNCDMLSYTIP